MMDDKRSISVRVGALSVSSLIGLNGCERQDPPTGLARNFRRSLKQWSVGWPEGRDKAREWSLWGERHAIGQLRSVRRGRRKAKTWNAWLWRISSSQHATKNLVRLRNCICETCVLMYRGNIVGMHYGTAITATLYLK